MENTPKAKQQQARENSARKKQIRVFQSSLDESSVCVISSELESQVVKLFRKGVDPKCSGKFKTAATELVIGLNQVLRAIQRNQVMLVLLEKAFAANMKTLISRMCLEKRIACIEMHLSDVKDLFEISQLTAMAFKYPAEGLSTYFTEIPKFLRQKLDIKISEKPDNPEEIKESSEKDTSNQPKSEVCFDIPKLLPSKVFERDRTIEKENYRREMEKRLFKTNEDDSIIKVAKKALSLPKRKREKELNVQVTIPGKVDNSKSAHLLAETIFEVDPNRKRPFKEPRLLKADVVVTPKNKKKKNRK